ncbi:MAG TPA: protein kinase, partial [Edaphobacter sp.]|uniref:protein kinase domain-containing protein n=1 Tax=Edaphobacter sp. TaxID=1934404 RepID=UPI002BB88B93
MSSMPMVPAPVVPLFLKKGLELKDRYVISEPCGSGGFGTVWRATDKQESRDVAIKRLSTRGADNIVALRQEADSIIKLKGHKNIVQVFEVFELGGEGFLVMEYVDGETLEATLRRHVRSSTWLEQDEALDYAKQTLEGLIYAHASGI